MRLMDIMQEAKFFGGNVEVPYKVLIELLYLVRASKLQVEYLCNVEMNVHVIHELTKALTNLEKACNAIE
jgi:hypothetical protein